MAEIAQDEANAKTASDEKKLLSAGRMIFSWPGLPYHHFPIADERKRYEIKTVACERVKRHPVME